MIAILTATDIIHPQSGSWSHWDRHKFTWQCSWNSGLYRWSMAWSRGLIESWGWEEI
jgi:hypothetical protein